MKYIDSHVHIGDATLVQKYITTSELRNKIRLYSALNPETVRIQEEYLTSCEHYIGLPIVLKEITVPMANDYLEDFKNNHIACTPAFLVGDNIKRYKKNSCHILKEHFLHHKVEEFEERKSSYEYLNSLPNGYLLIHCSDSKRIWYVQMLRLMYPQMKTIIAHMGRNVYEDFDFSKHVIDAFKEDDKVLYDTSTIKNEQIIKYALHEIGDERILFGTDFPYECKANLSDNHFFDTISRVGLSNESLNKIVYENAKRVIFE